MLNDGIRLAIRSVILAIGFWCLHKILQFLMFAIGVRLGAVSSQSVPLYATPEFQFSDRILVVLVVVIGLNFFTRVKDLPPFSKKIYFVSLAFLYFWVIGLTVSMIDGFREIETGRFIPAFLEPYTRIKMEYFGDVPLVDRVGFLHFLKNYPKPEIFDQLSLHAKTHPPGGVIFLWLISKIFGNGLLAASLATIGFTSLTIIPIFLLCKDLYNEIIARKAILLFLILPNFVMFTTTSMDGVFSVFPILSVYLFFRVTRREDLKIAIALGISMAIGFMLTYSTVFVGLFFAIYVLLIFIFDHENFGSIFRKLIIAFGAFVGFFVMIFLVSGFNLGESLIRSIRKDAEQMGSGHESITRYFLISLGNLSAFMIGVGFPIVILWFQNVKKFFRERDLFPMAFLISLLLITFSTLYTMEVERIWIFMAPFVILPIARSISETEFRWAIALLSVQLILMEMFFYTHW